MKTRTLWITVATVAGLALAGGAAAAAAPTPGTPTPTATPTPADTPSPSPTSSPGVVDADDLARAVDAALAEVGPGVVIDIDRDDDPGHAYEIDVLLDAGGSAEVYLDADFRVVAVQHDDRGAGRGADDTPGRDDRGGSDAARAAEVALAYVGRGVVVEVERDDDPGVAWEVEIELPDGDDVDVELDADFRVVSAR